MKARSLAEWQVPGSIVGKSPATSRLRAEIRRIAPFASNVLISGPSGTGKELVARQIHALSPRRNRPFVPVDCATMTGELMTSQLFGHVAGAFTGANCDALGCFRAANQGTLFLDEIGDLEHSLQAKLLRVLQDHVVTPVGSYAGERVDVRVVAATNRDLRREMLAGRFREDLYYRLDVVQLRTAALGERRSDIPALCEAFLRQLANEGLPRCSLSPEATGVLLEFDWPGNVRQLRNALEQAAIDSDAPVIPADLLRRILSLSHTSQEASAESPPATWDALPEPLNRDSVVIRQSSPKQPDTAWLTLQHVEKYHIQRTLEHTFYNRSAAARLLGVTRQTLLRRMKQYDLGGPESGSR